jgi:hypothetical protein
MLIRSIRRSTGLCDNTALFTSTRRLIAGLSSDVDSYATPSWQSKVVNHAKNNEYDKAVMLWEKNNKSANSNGSPAASASLESQFAALVAYCELYKPGKVRALASQLCDTCMDAISHKDMSIFVYTTSTEEQQVESETAVAPLVRLVPNLLLRSYCRADNLEYTEAMLLRWMSAHKDEQRDKSLSSKYSLVSMSVQFHVCSVSSELLEHLKSIVKPATVQKVILSSKADSMLQVILFSASSEILSLSVVTDLCICSARTNIMGGLARSNSVLFHSWSMECMSRSTILPRKRAQADATDCSRVTTANE